MVFALIVVELCGMFVSLIYEKYAVWPRLLFQLASHGRLINNLNIIYTKIGLDGACF